MKYAKRIAIAFVACLITLACVELVYSEMHLNVYRGGGTSEGPVWSWIIYDPLMGWMNKPRYIKPNQFRIDKNGFRIIESSSSPDKNKRLIVCMGDSGTFGIWAAREDSKFGGLEFDSFPFYLQGILFGRNDKIINAGTIGYSSAHLLRQYVVSIRKLKPQIIAYVSCDPSTLARDAARLIQGGYKLKEVTPFDLFPQTYHIESISLFEK